MHVCIIADLQRSTRLMKTWKSRGTEGRRPVTGSRYTEGDEESAEDSGTFRGKEMIVVCYSLT